jgi:hypothetical protein
MSKKVLQHVPTSEVGNTVQVFINSGSRNITVTPDPGGNGWTITIS